MKKITVIFITILFLVGCSKESKKEDNDVTYSVETVEDAPTVGYINVDGKIEAKDTLGVFVDKKLKVKEVFVQEGDYVKKGQLLMTFDESERNNIKRELEKENLAISKLKRDYNVEIELNKLGGSSNNYLKDLYEQIRTKSLTIETLSEDLEKTTEKILSPVSGTITTLLAQENYSVNTDEALLMLADLSDMKIILEVPEYEVKNIYLNQTLVIKPEVFEKKKSYKGKIVKISKISIVSEKTSDNVLEVEVKTDEIIPFIVPGFKVSATIYLTGDSKGILVKKTALLYKDNKYFMFIINSENIIEEREVTYRELKGDKIEIIKGIKKEEKYIANPTLNLVTGTKIKV